MTTRQPDSFPLGQDKPSVEGNRRVGGTPLIEPSGDLERLNLLEGVY